MPLNATHDPALRSWVESANQADSEFPIQNLPFAVFAGGHGDARPRVGVGIGDVVLDLARLSERGLLAGEPAATGEACRASSLNALMALGEVQWSRLRARVSRLLRDDGDERDERRAIADCLVPRDAVRLLLPATVGDYTDFYASVFHATNVGSLFRPDNPLLPNYKYVPIGYHGRASSLVPSGTAVVRPVGQIRPDPQRPPLFGPSARLDYELELGWFIGSGNELGRPITMAEAEGRIFGFCLVNDWSARDIQAWEYQPLGPFLAKSFATTVSPWVVTAEALEPFRVPAYERPATDPQPLPYLDAARNRERGALDITLEVLLSTERMRAEGKTPERVSRGAFRDMYWTPAQMLVHHASNGCNLRPGDLLASGTVSGPAAGSQGCLLEITRGGREALRLGTGEERRFLQDGDEVVFRARAEHRDFRAIGFGECRGRVLPALQSS